MVKKIITLSFAALCLLPSAFCQIKIVKATSQKTIAGMGGVYMSYVIEFKEKKNKTVEIDSVKTIADAAVLNFSPNKNGLTFRIALAPPAKCKTCVETTPPQSNLTKGVIVYGKRDGKKSTFKVKKFAQLEDVMMP